MKPDPEIVIVSPPISERYAELNDEITGCSKINTGECDVLRPMKAETDVVPCEMFTAVAQIDFKPDAYEQLGNTNGPNINPVSLKSKPEPTIVIKTDALRGSTLGYTYEIKMS
jgi:hypothetical protein